MRKGLPAVLTCLHRGFYLGVAQLVERLFWEQEVAGSSPVVSTTNLKGRASYDSIGKAGAYGNLCPLHDW